MPDQSENLARLTEAFPALADVTDAERLDYIQDIQQQSFMEMAKGNIVDLQNYLGEHAVRVPETTLTILAVQAAAADSLLHIVGTLRTLAGIDENVKGALQAAFLETLSNDAALDAAMNSEWADLVHWLNEHYGIRVDDDEHGTDGA